MKTIPEMYQEALAKQESQRTEQEKAIIKAYELRYQEIGHQKITDPAPEVSKKQKPAPKSARETIEEALAKPENQRTEAEKLALSALESIKRAGLNALTR